ncbi:hypothetical protein AKJ48_01570 [candidate division MSBL1 archaeon SCGC-AAA261O19]|uniref:Uncharacterized protein n=1 Tax=candidate division MSBL1 archaeon SCGC-AAA261O19 TaxID=1698277 RepID=A0A133VEA1_9EURY|nr:hypothetical protein AKJ48_01570 [candidate division MSBL1 archaeon SCGC-AAA261O19]
MGAYISKLHDGLTEYVSGTAGVKCVSLVADEFGSKSRAGEELGVSHAAVIDWLDSEGSHPSNARLRQIIDLALKMREEETFTELEKDLARHRSSLGENQKRSPVAKLIPIEKFLKLQ